MRNTRSRRSRHSGRNDGSLWLSFSDLMSSLLMIIILVLFYLMYQYFEMYEINMAEIARQQYDLDQANATLEQERAKLTETEQQMLAQQIRLNAAEDELADAEAILAAQQEELAGAQALLTEKETEIEAQQVSLAELSAQLNAQKSQLTAQQNQLTDQQSRIDAQQAQLDSQEAQIEQLVGLRTRIIESLSKSLKANKIAAEVDPNTGSITLESDVLFSTGKHDLTKSGMANIDSFLPIYLDVLLSEENKPYVSEIIIEGHTDRLGSYLENMVLSMERAYAVSDYVLSGKCKGITAKQRNALQELLSVNGRSYSELVFNSKGQADWDASRRVVFKFRLTDERMIEQLQSILESND